MLGKTLKIAVKLRKNGVYMEINNDRTVIVYIVNKNKAINGMKH